MDLASHRVLRREGRAAVRRSAVALATVLGVFTSITWSTGGVQVWMRHTKCPGHGPDRAPQLVQT